MSSPQQLTPPLIELLEACEKNFTPPSQVCMPGTPGYIASTTEHYYWVSSELTPAYVLQPGSHEDVRKAMEAISTINNTYPGQIPFAVKGGGHFAVPGSNSGPGALIDLLKLNQIIFNPGTKTVGPTVDVGPGQIWDNVYDKIKDTGYNVNGATTCANVGVAGFLLGGGFGNKSNRFGLAIDNINSLDVVLPTGKYVPGVSDTNDPDLFWALRGGGNNFGIVTNWCLPTHVQAPNIYSRTALYKEEYFPQLVEAIYKYGLQRDPMANVEAIFEYTYLKGVYTAVAHIEMYYDEAMPPGHFEEFLRIPHTWEQVSKTWMERQRRLPTNRQTYLGRSQNTEDLPPFRGRYSSVMISHYTESIIKFTLDRCKHYSELMAEHGGLQIYPDFWPFIPAMFDKSPPCAWPHSAGHPSGPLVINFKWLHAKDDGFWLKAIEAITKEIRELALAERLTKRDTPAYINLSLDGVQTHDIYQGNMHRLSQLRKQFDPQDVMRNTGGFRIPLA